MQYKLYHPFIFLAMFIKVELFKLDQVFIILNVTIFNKDGAKTLERFFHEQLYVTLILLWHVSDYLIKLTRS